MTDPRPRGRFALWIEAAAIRYLVSRGYFATADDAEQFIRAAHGHRFPKFVREVRARRRQ